MTHPSLTRAVQKLEEEFGGKLFRRERSRTHLTDLGRMMHPHLERTFEAACRATELARGVGKRQVTRLALGVATVAASSTAAGSFVIPARARRRTGRANRHPENFDRYRRSS